MPSATRSSHQTKTDILIGIMSVSLYIILCIIFISCLSINNRFLLMVNRTLATTLLTFTAMTAAMHAVYGGFDVGRKKNKPVISAMVSAVFITDMVTYLQLEIMNVNENYNTRLTLFGPDLLCLLLCLLLQILVIILFVRIGNQIYFYFNPPRKCLLILGSPSQEAPIRDKIGHYRLQWKVTDAVLYNVPDLELRIRKADVIFLGKVPEGAKFALLKICYDDRKDVMCKAQLEDIMLCNARPAIVDDAAFLAMEYNKITVFQRCAKRIGDIVLSALALILFSPFIAIIALLIKLEDHGPVIFRQSRLTADGKTFTIRKFRTMTPHSEQDEVQVSVAVDDPRITKIGAFLRRYRLDEIPQFFNILIGDMSLVGPRPEMMSNVARYKMALPAFVYREKMKAGLTGYAQIEGRYNTSAEDKLMLDMMYIESFSVWLDVKLLLRTFTVLMKKDSTEGFHPAPEYVDNRPDQMKKDPTWPYRKIPDWADTRPINVQAVAGPLYAKGRPVSGPVSAKDVQAQGPVQGYTPPRQDAGRPRRSSGQKSGRQKTVPDQVPAAQNSAHEQQASAHDSGRQGPVKGYTPGSGNPQPGKQVSVPKVMQGYPPVRDSSTGNQNARGRTINHAEDKKNHEHNTSYYGGRSGVPIRREQANRQDRT